MNSTNQQKNGDSGDAMVNEDSSNAKAQSRDMAGTQLFTITEKPSVTTMKTLPLDGTFQRRIISAQPQVTFGAGDFSDNVNSLRRRDRFSLDEHALQKLHLASDV